jgi:endogenous inhibitor of DNA gyrase (YacG/DUF329 family)
MSAAKCPICGKLAEGERLPFCSPRCADIDLQRWLSGRYVVPGSEGTLDRPPSDEDID